MKKNKNSVYPEKLPVMPLVDKVLFPNMVLPILVGREQSLQAVMTAMNDQKMLFVVSQKENKMDDLKVDDINKHGTIAIINNVIRLPNGLLKVVLEGLQVAIIENLQLTKTNYFECSYKLVEFDVPKSDKNIDILFKQFDRLYRILLEGEKTQLEDLETYNNFDTIQQKIYYVIGNLNEKTQVKQKVLEVDNIKEQLEIAIQILQTEIEILKVKNEINAKIHEKMLSNQKKAIIQEQIRILKQELGDDEDFEDDEIKKLKEKAIKAKMPKHTYDKFLEEIKKFSKIHPYSPEAAVNRAYIEWLLNVPWSKKSKDNIDITKVKEILDKDHFGLEKPKDRILEFISVLNLVKSLKGQILCFVGPPGVGKTSLAMSIARALNRKFVRISLGGVRDEAEIRGHRRTYVGALPGKIIQAMKKAGTVNPLILLDEIDKMSSDFRGDPASAMLEVLDPEQNKAFNDHYLEVDYDLSKVLFITTANVMYNIPAPLLDRMEVIELPGYLEHEKIEIAKNYIIPKETEANGLKKAEIIWTDEALKVIINNYTREAGVRNLQRVIANILRKIAKKIVEGNKKYNKIKITEKVVHELLRTPKYLKDFANLEHKIGVVNGLAWTSTGGDVLIVEGTLMKGSQKLILTGKLGEVMKESATCALSFVKANALKLGISEDAFENKDIHIHFPEGAIPKDGPSAGISIATVITSLFSSRKIRSDYAMTGEITLQGNILPIGGLNEKLLAAKRVGIKNIIIPKDNEKDLEDVKQEIKKDLNFIFAENFFDIVDKVFVSDQVN